MIVDRSARSFRSDKSYKTNIRFTASPNDSLNGESLTITINSGKYSKKTIKLNMEETYLLREILNK